MKKLLPLLVLAMSMPLFAQTFYPRTDTFAFDKTNAITSWNGSDPANPPYPYEMGSVSLGNQSGIAIPFQLGYLNNGDLEPCDPITWGAKTWIIGNGTHSGDTYTLPGSAACPYFTGEYGTSGNSSKTHDSFSVTVTYVRTLRRVCYRGGCSTQITDTEQGGMGTAEQTVTQ